MAWSVLCLDMASATWMQEPGAQSGTAKLVTKDPLKDAIMSQSWTSFYISHTDYRGKNLPSISHLCLIF